MNKQDFLKLIDKYLKGECLPDEELLLEKYLDSFQNTNGSWSSQEMGDKQILEDQIYSEIMLKIHGKNRNIIQKAFHSPYLLKIAASIFILITIATGAMYLAGIFSPKSPSLSWAEKTTAMGEKLVLTLADNSKITLNAGSKLKYPFRFNGYSRDVYLEGEAYFEVQHDSTKPFVVHTNGIATTVLGTKFDVESFANDKNISVSLVEGSVKVSKVEPERTEALVMLKPDQQLIYNKEKEISIVQQFDEQEAVGWKDNILKFDNQPLSKVFVALERRFGIKFELNNESLSSKKITANFKDESVWTVSEVIKKLTGLHYKTIKDKNELKKIVFYKK